MDREFEVYLRNSNASELLVREQAPVKRPRSLEELKEAVSAMGLEGNWDQLPGDCWRFSAKCGSAIHWWDAEKFFMFETPTDEGDNFIEAFDAHVAQLWPEDISPSCEEQRETHKMTGSKTVDGEANKILVELHQCVEQMGDKTYQNEVQIWAIKHVCAEVLAQVCALSENSDRTFETIVKRLEGVPYQAAKTVPERYVHVLTKALNEICVCADNLLRPRH